MIYIPLFLMAVVVVLIILIAINCYASTTKLPRFRIIYNTGLKYYTVQYRYYDWAVWSSFEGGYAESTIRYNTLEEAVDDIKKMVEQKLTYIYNTENIINVKVDATLGNVVVTTGDNS